MSLGKNHSVRLPEAVDNYLESLRAERGPGTKMSEILRPILWEWYKSEMERNGKEVSLPTAKKILKARSV